jgi:hypothetical protein
VRGSARQRCDSPVSLHLCRSYESASDTRYTKTAEMIETFEQIGREQTAAIVRELPGAPGPFQSHCQTSAPLRQPGAGQSESGRLRLLYEKAQSRYQ